MSRTAISVFAILTLVTLSGIAEARGGRPGGSFCRTDRSCASGSCVYANPDDKFGACCTEDSCANLGAQCGFADNGCGGELYCGECDSSTTCEANQCVPVTTTTLPPTTTTSTTNTTTTMLVTTTTLCPNGVPSCEAPSQPCQEPLFCYVLSTAENPCGECVSNWPLCQDLVQCTASSQCAANEVCIVNSCCEGTGVCSPRCGTDVD
jgi:hypothetical protein